MKLACPLDAAGPSVTVDLSNTYRYASTMASYGFQTVAWWVGRGLPRLNYCGQGWEGYSAAMIPVTLAYSGTPTRLKLTLPVFVSNPRCRTFRWAVVSQRLDALFLGSGPVPADNPFLLAQGKFTPDWNNGGIVSQTFDLTGLAALPSAFYIYLWRSSTKYGNIHITGNVTVRVYTMTGAFAWREAVPWLYTGSGWRRASPRLYTGSGWNSG